MNKICICLQSQYPVRETNNFDSHLGDIMKCKFFSHSISGVQNPLQIMLIFTNWYQSCTLEKEIANLNVTIVRKITDNHQKKDVMADFKIFPKKSPKYSSLQVIAHCVYHFCHLFLLLDQRPFCVSLSHLKNTS